MSDMSRNSPSNVPQELHVPQCPVLCPTHNFWGTFERLCRTCGSGANPLWDKKRGHSRFFQARRQLGVCWRQKIVSVFIGSFKGIVRLLVFFGRDCFFDSVTQGWCVIIRNACFFRRRSFAREAWCLNFKCTLFVCNGHRILLLHFYFSRLVENYKVDMAKL
jgi:hypothetical protein